MPTGCTLTGYTGGPWTVTCVGAGPFNFGTVVVPSGHGRRHFRQPNHGGDLHFRFDSSGAVTLSVKLEHLQCLRQHLAERHLRVRAGIYNYRRGIITGGGSTTSFAPALYQSFQLDSCGNYRSAIPARRLLRSSSSCWPRGHL